MKLDAVEYIKVACSLKKTILFHADNTQSVFAVTDTPHLQVNSNDMTIILQLQGNNNIN
jgi:hypothetical protein